MMFPVEYTNKNGLITCKPIHKGNKFPLFDEIENNNGYVRGWKKDDKPGSIKMEMFDFGRPGQNRNVEVVSADTDKVVFKIVD